MRLTTYLNLTVAHLVPIEGLFAYVAMEMPEYGSALQYINYMYLCFVALHGVHYFHKRLLIVRKVMEALQKPRPCEKCGGTGTLEPTGSGSYLVMGTITRTAYPGRADTNEELFHKPCPDCDGKGQICLTEAQIEAKVNEIVATIPVIMGKVRSAETWWHENEAKVTAFMAVLSSIDLTKVAKAIERAKPELDRIAAPAPPPPDDFAPWCNVVDCRCSGFESSPSCGILACGKCGHSKMAHKGGRP